MNERIYPRSPRETMDGWIYLPRYLDKIRLHLAGTLHSDYTANFGKGFDGVWLKAAGVTHEQMIEVVKHSPTDGQVCDWVRQNVRKTAAEKAAHRADLENRPTPGDAAGQARFQERKAAYGLAGRADVTRYLDLLDADEARL